MYPDPKDQLQPFLTQSAHSYTLNPEEPLRRLYGPTVPG